MPHLRTSDPPDRSPLERIVGSRASIASEASGELGILDSFPLPAGIVPPSPQNSPDSSGNWSANSSIVDLHPNPDTHIKNSNVELPKTAKSSPYPVLATERRYRRYGHHYQLSNDSDSTGVASSSQTSMSSGEIDETKVTKTKKTPSPLKLTSISNPSPKRYQFPDNWEISQPNTASVPTSASRLANSPLKNAQNTHYSPSIPPIGVQSAPPSAAMPPLPDLPDISLNKMLPPPSTEARSPTSARSQFLPQSRRFHHATSYSAHSVLPSTGSPSKPAPKPALLPLLSTASGQIEPHQLYTSSIDSQSAPTNSHLATNGTNPSNSRPRATRAHSVSQSWDAGNPTRSYPPPPPLNLSSLAPPAMPSEPSFEEHIKIGINLMTFSHNLVLAHRHWEAAAAPPLCSSVGMLLLVLGHSERWFPLGLLVSPTVADPRIDFKQPASTVGLVWSRLPPVTELQRLLGPALLRVMNAIRSYADKLLARQLDLEALRFLELSGDLGSAQSLMTAATIYYKGSRRVRKDIGRSTRLFERANKLTG